MLIYSVTLNIDTNIHEEWLRWMRENHIPDVMAAGYFTEYAFQEIIYPEPEPGSRTYNVQYLAPSREAYEAYQREAAPQLQAEHNARYKSRFVAFRSLLTPLEK